MEPEHVISAPEREDGGTPFSFDEPILIPDRTPRYRARRAADPPGYSTFRTNMALWLLLVASSAFVAGTTAAFSASTSEARSKFGTVALVEPSLQTLTLGGSDLTMSVDSFGGVAGGTGTVGVRWRYYWPTGVSSQGNSPLCSASTANYTDATKDLGSSTTVSKTAAYPTSDGGVSTDGRWMCVMSLTTYPATDPVGSAQQWLSQIDNPAGPVQVGHVVQKVTLQNGGASTAGTLSVGDKIIVQYNQDVDATGRPAPTSICSRGSGGGNRIMLGRVSVNCNIQADDQTQAVEIGNLLWQGSGNIASTSLNVSSVWTTARQLEMTVTTGSLALTNCTVALGNSGCFRLSTQYVDLPGSALESATGAKALCTAQPAGAPDAGICWPLTSGRP